MQRLGTNAPTSFAITRALVRKRATGEVIEPLSVRANGKKFEIVVFESAATPTPASAGAKLIVNGKTLKSDYLTTETGAPIFVTQLKQFMLATPGTLTVEVVRADGTHSNTLTLQVVAAQ